MLRCSHTVTVLIIHGLIVAQQCSTGWYRGLWFRWTFYNYCTHWGTVSSVCNLHNFTCHTSRIREVFREHIQNYRAEVVLNQGHKQELFQLGEGSPPLFLDQWEFNLEWSKYISWGGGHGPFLSLPACFLMFIMYIQWIYVSSNFTRRTFKGNTSFNFYRLYRMMKITSSRSNSDINAKCNRPWYCGAAHRNDLVISTAAEIVPLLMFYTSRVFTQRRKSSAAINDTKPTTHSLGYLLLLCQNEQIILFWRRERDQVGGA